MLRLIQPGLLSPHASVGLPGLLALSLALSLPLSLALPSAHALSPKDERCLSRSYDPTRGKHRMDCVEALVGQARALREAGQIPRAAELHEALATRSPLHPNVKSIQRRWAISLWRRLVDENGGRCADEARGFAMRGREVCAGRMAMMKAHRDLIEADCVWLEEKARCRRPKPKPPASPLVALPSPATASAAAGPPRPATAVTAPQPGCWQDEGCRSRLIIGGASGASMAAAGGVFHVLAWRYVREHPTYDHSDLTPYRYAANAGYSLALTAAAYLVWQYFWGAPTVAVAQRPMSPGPARSRRRMP